MNEIGDAVAREFGRRSLARHTSRACEHPPCPDCGSPGQRREQRTRRLITSRGLVPVTEAKFHCPKCRRLFFPSDRCAGA
jgi:transposase-like protein